MAAGQDNQAWESGHISYQLNDPSIIIYPPWTSVSSFVMRMLFDPHNMVLRKQETEKLSL